MAALYQVYNVVSGSSIDDTVFNATQVATNTGTEVHFDFENVHVIARASDDPAVLRDQFRNARRLNKNFAEANRIY